MCGYPPIWPTSTMPASRRRLYRSADIAAELRGAGFVVCVLRAYGRMLPSGNAAFVATQPRAT